MYRINLVFLVLILTLGIGSQAPVLFAPNGNGANAGSSSSLNPSLNSSLKLTLPNASNSVKFLVIGDTGTGGRQQQELAKVMMDYHTVFPYEFVLLMGDNMYGGEKPEDFKRKFEDVYQPLLDKGVKFYASLGNHDEAVQRNYELFNMNGAEYYKFKKGSRLYYYRFTEGSENYSYGIRCSF